MLGLFQHDKAKKIFLVICALLMLTFGVNSMSGSGETQYVATIDDSNVSFMDYERQRQAVEQRHRQTFGEQFESYRRFLNINQEALDNSINDVLLRKLIGKLDIATSLEIIEKQIVSSPFFEGSYSPEKFNSYKQALQMSGAQIQDLFGRETARLQLVRLIQDTTFASKAELQAIFNNNETKRTFRFVAFDPETFKASVTVSDEALQQYFTENQEQYRKPRAVSYEFVEFEAARYADQVEVTEEDLQYLYEDKKSEYLDAAQVRLSWIKKDKKTEAVSKLEELVLSEEEKDQKLPDTGKDDAQALLKKLDDGSDFAELAKSDSSDEASAQNGGDIGWKKIEELEPAISKAVNLLEVGDYTNVIDTDSGYYIVKLEEEKEARVKEFAEVRDIIEQEFRSEEAPAYAYSAAQKFYDALRATEKASLSQKAVAENLATVATQGLVTSTDSPAGVPQGLTAEVIDAAPGAVELVELNGKTYVVSILEERESAIPELAEVNDKVKADLTKKLAADEAKNKADALLAQLTETKDAPAPTLTEAAAAAGYEATETGAVTKAANPENAPAFLSDQTAKTQLLKLHTANAVHSEVISATNKYFVVELASIVLPEQQAFAEKAKELATQEDQQQLSRIFNALIETMKAKAQIWTNPAVQEQSPIKTL